MWYHIIVIITTDWAYWDQITIFFFIIIRHTNKCRSPQQYDR